MQFPGNTDADALSIFCTTSPACMCEAPMMVLIREGVSKIEFSCAAVIVGTFGCGGGCGMARIATTTAPTPAAKPPPAMSQPLPDLRGRGLVSCDAYGCIGCDPMGGPG